MQRPGSHCRFDDSGARRDYWLNTLGQGGSAESYDANGPRTEKLLRHEFQRRLSDHLRSRYQIFVPEHTIPRITDWLIVHGTKSERYGWSIVLAELETGEELSAEDAKELFGADWQKEYNWYRVAKHRLMTLLREAFAD